MDQRNPKSLNGKPLKCSLWNVTSMVHQTEKIMEYIVEHDSDVLFISKTWLRTDVNNVTALVKDNSYKLIQNRISSYSTMQV